MRTFKKIILYGLCAVVVLAAGGTVILKLLFPTAKLRALLQEQVRTRLHRTVQIGDVSLGLTGLAFERLKLSEPPDFKAGTFLYVEKAILRWRLLPLLRHAIVLKEVRLENPQLNLVREKDGSAFNISDLIAGGGRSQPTASIRLPAPARSPWTWYVTQIHLLEGSVHLNDLSPARQSTSLNHIDLLIHDFDATRMSGELKIRELRNTFYNAQDFSTEWMLEHMDSGLAHLNGWAQLDQGPGSIENISGVAASGKSAKILFLPFELLSSLDRLGIIQLGLPNLSHWKIQSIHGNYQFKDGWMEIKNFHVASSLLSMDAQGSIHLPTEALSVNLTLDSPRLPGGAAGKMHATMHLSGTLSNPKTDLNSLKKQAFRASLQGLLQRPGAADDLNKALHKIFH